MEQVSRNQGDRLIRPASPVPTVSWSIVSEARSRRSNLRASCSSSLRCRAVRLFSGHRYLPPWGCFTEFQHLHKRLYRSFEIDLKRVIHRLMFGAALALKLSL